MNEQMSSLNLLSCVL